MNKEIQTDQVGRPPRVLSDTEIIQVEALAAVCTKAQLANYFDVSEKTFRAIEERQSAVSTAYRKGRARAIAEVGSLLLQKALDGDMKAVQFYLKTRAGWSENSADSGSEADRQPLIINIVQPEGA